MPNHITNYVEIKGSQEQIASLAQRTLREANGETLFDFNGILPMPEELRETVAPTEVVDTQEEANRRNAEHAKSVLGQVGEKIKAITQAEADRRQELYGPGIKNWYDWAYSYWGTKWNAYEVEILHQNPDRIVVSFQTAWASPEPIFDHLVSEGFEVNCMWQDEDPSNYGEYGNPWRVFYRESTIEFAG